MSPLIPYAWVQSVSIRAELSMESEIDAIDQTAPSVSPQHKSQCLGDSLDISWISFCDNNILNTCMNIKISYSAIFHHNPNTRCYYLQLSTGKVFFHRWALSGSRVCRRPSGRATGQTITVSALMSVICLESFSNAQGCSFGCAWSWRFFLIKYVYDGPLNVPINCGISGLIHQFIVIKFDTILGINV